MTNQEYILKIVDDEICPDKFQLIKEIRQVMGIDITSAMILIHELVKRKLIQIDPKTYKVSRVQN